MSFLINPFAFAVADGDFEPIATVTVGSGGAAYAEFTNIPQTYQHLQVRCIGRSSSSASNQAAIVLSINGTNLEKEHGMYGDGSSAGAFNGSAYNWNSTTSVSLANTFAAAVVDILDYTSTTKNKVVRTFNGLEMNGSGYVLLYSGLRLTTNAVTSIRFFDSIPGNWTQHSTFALYGIKAP